MQVTTCQTHTNFYSICVRTQQAGWAEWQWKGNLLLLLRSARLQGREVENRSNCSNLSLEVKWNYCLWSETIMQQEEISERGLSWKASSANPGSASWWIQLATCYIFKINLLGHLLSFPNLENFCGDYELLYSDRKHWNLYLRVVRGRWCEGISQQSKPQNCKGNLFPSRFQYHRKTRVELIYLHMLSQATPKEMGTLGMHWLVLRQVIWLLNHRPTYMVFV